MIREETHQMAKGLRAALAWNIYSGEYYIRECDAGTDPRACFTDIIGETEAFVYRVMVIGASLPVALPITDVTVLPEESENGSLPLFDETDQEIADD